MLAYLHSRWSRTTRVSMWARRTLKTETRIIKEDRQHWGHRVKFNQQQKQGGGVSAICNLSTDVCRFFPFHMSGVPRVLSVFVYRCSVRHSVLPASLVFLPVQIMTYGCDFLHPYAFLLLSRVPQNEGHQTIFANHLVPQNVGSFDLQCA